jgi:hypothetical protein
MKIELNSENTLNNSEINRKIYIDFITLNEMLAVMTMVDIKNLMLGRNVVAMDDDTYNFFDNLKK